MQFSRTRHGLLAVLLGAVLMLAGCGGDDGVDQGVHDMALAAQAEAEAEAAAAEAARMEAEAEAAAEAEAKAAAEAEAAAAEAARMAAEMAEREAEQAQAAAEAAQMAAEEDEAAAEMRAQEAEEAAEMAQGAAEEAAKAAMEAAEALKEAQAALMEAEEARTMAEEEAETEEAARMMAEADRMKLEAEKMTAEMASRAATLHPAMSIINPGEDNTTDPDGDYGDKARATDPIDAQLEDDVMPGKVVLPTGAPGSLAFTHTETTGTKVTAVSAVGLPLTGYVPPADGMAPEIDGWDGLVLTRRDAVDAASQILYAYTDVATVATETFYQKYGAQLSQNQLTVNNENLGLASSDSFPGADEGPQDFAVPTTGEGRFSGTFDGVPGTFACTGTGACTITPNAVTGALTLSGTGVLNFSPEDGNAVISRARSDYLYFGYWLHKPTAPSGAHRFSVVSGGSDPFDVRDEGESTVHALSGRASYSGSAAGKYVTRDLTAGTARIGQFTATASLSADFNATASWAKKVAADAAANADEDLTIAGAVMTNVAGAGMVSGTITDFMEGDEPLHNWHVRLDGAGLAAIGQAEHSVAVDATDGSLTVTAMDGTGMTASGESTTQFTSSVTARVGAAADIPGQWVGRFYGNDRADGRPEAIAGAFEVHAPHVAITGAFGAYNQAE